MHSFKSGPPPYTSVPTRNPWVQQSPLQGSGLYAHAQFDTHDIIRSEPPILERRGEIIDGHGRPLQPAFDNFFANVKAMDMKESFAFLMVDTGNFESPVPSLGYSFLEVAKRLMEPMSITSETTARIASTFNRFCFRFSCDAHSDIPVYKLFHNVGLINHSCNPNAEAHWHPLKKELVVRAVRPITHGEEITIAYKTPLGSRSQRWKALGFQCTYEVCRLTGEEFEEHELRRKAAGKSLATLQKFRAKYFGSNYEHEPLFVGPGTLKLFANERSQKDLRSANNAALQVRAIATKLGLCHGSLGIAQETLRIEPMMALMEPSNVLDIASNKVKATVAAMDDMWHVTRYWGMDHPRSTKIRMIANYLGGLSGEGIGSLSRDKVWNDWSQQAAL